MEIQELLKYGVPKSIIKEFQKRGYEKLTQVQESAVESGIFTGKSFVISAPTNTGKTFIAELAILSSILNRASSKTFYLIPLN